MTGKTKGTNAERELIHLFWEKAWAAIRVAGSGSSRYPSPDVLAGNNIRKLAIECKAVGSLHKYISIEQIDDLVLFSRMFGAEPWIGLRFDRMEWLFVPAGELEKSETTFRISLEHARRIGLFFEELIR